MAKMFEDAFRALGIIKDDAPQFVAQSIITSIDFSAKKRKAKMDASGTQAHAKDEDYLEITITPYDQP